MRAPGTVADAVVGELRRNKLSARINYEVVHILSQNLQEDATGFPDAPGPIAQHLSTALGALSPRANSLASTAHTPSDRRDFSENVSVHSSYDSNDEPRHDADV